MFILHCTLIYSLPLEFLESSSCRAVHVLIFFIFCSPMVKESVEISTDEESDSIVISPPDGNARDCEEVVSGSEHDSSPEGQTTSIEPAIDGDTEEDKLVNQDSVKLIDQEISPLPKSPAKPSMSGSERSKRTVPQPFTLSTQRKASGGGNGGVAHPPSDGEKSGQRGSVSPASMIKKVGRQYLCAL